MKKQNKLILKGIADDGVPFKKEIHSLNEVKSSGNYVVICKKASSDNGLPQINGKSHSCFCCEAQLTVTCCYSEDEAQSNAAYGQTLTICDRETGTTLNFVRTISPNKNNGNWSKWNIAECGNEQLVLQNKSISDYDYRGVNPITCAPIDIFNGYYTTDGVYHESTSLQTYIYELSGNVLYSLTTIPLGAQSTANFIVFDHELMPIVAIKKEFTNQSLRNTGVSFIGILNNSINPDAYVLKACSSYYIKNERIAPNSIDGNKIIPFSLSPENTSLFYSKNMFDKNNKDVVLGGYDVGTGIQSNSSLNYSGYIPVGEGEAFVFSADGAFANARFVTFYDSELNYVIPDGYSVCYANSVSTITIPAGVFCVRLTIQASYWETFQMEKGTTPTAYEEYAPKIIENYLPDFQQSSFEIETKTEPISRNIANPTTITYGDIYININNGGVSSASGDWGGHTDYIPITEAGLAIKGGYYGGAAIGYAVYDKNKNFIRGAKADFVAYKDGDAFVRFTIRKDSEVMVCRGVMPMDYEPYKGMRVVATPPHGVRQEVKISLPDKIYAVVGDTLQLFYRGIIQAVNPYNYNILISCSKGSQYPRYFEYTPTTSDIGTVDFKIIILDNNRNIIAASACKLITVAVTKSPTEELKVMCFGDSLTTAGTWCREVDRRLTESEGSPAGNGLNNISFVGSKANDTTGYFGIGGWTWSSYTTEGKPAIRFNVTGVTSLVVGTSYSNNGYTYTIREVNVTEGCGNILCAVDNASYLPQDTGVLTKKTGYGDNSIVYTSYTIDTQNPLWDGEKMSFIPYANKVSDGQIDVVYTLLSWNGLIPHKSNFSDIIEQAKIFADTLHAEFPDAKLKIMGVQVPCVNGGMGANYGATGTSYADGYGMVVTALNMNWAYQEFANSEGYSGFVEFVNVSSQFDSEYCMPYSDIPVNSRCAITERRGTNGVHPANEGYMQIADVVYRNFVANFCQ